MNTMHTLRRKFFLGLVLGMLALLTVGAARLQGRLRMQEQAAAQAGQRVNHWHLQIADELPIHQREAWRKIGQEDPMALLQACTTSEPVKP